jgi:hypothetical protein
MVMFMYRPEVDENDPNAGKETRISIAKHRNGTLARGREAIRLESKMEIQKFYNSELLPVQASLPMGMGSNWKPVKDITESNKTDLEF